MEFHVFIRRGDARAEVDSLLRQLGSTPEAAGMHKYIFVAKADQTVVMLVGPDVPLAQSLRGRAGWQEPSAQPGS